MKKILNSVSCFVFVILLLSACANPGAGDTPLPDATPLPNEPPQINLSPPPATTGLEAYGDNLFEGVYQGMENASIRVKAQDTSNIQSFTAEDKVLEDIRALNIRTGDNVLITFEIVENNLPKAIQIEKEQ